MSKTVTARKLDDGYHKFPEKEMLVVKPEDWTRAEWRTLCKFCGLDPETTERIVMNVESIECYVGPNKDDCKPDGHADTVQAIGDHPRFSAIGKGTIQALREATRRIIALQAGFPTNSIDSKDVDDVVFSDLDLTKGELTAIFAGHPCYSMSFDSAKDDPVEDDGED